MHRVCCASLRSQFLWNTNNSRTNCRIRFRQTLLNVEFGKCLLNIRKCLLGCLGHRRSRSPRHCALDAVREPLLERGRRRVHARRLRDVQVADERRVRARSLLVHRAGRDHLLVDAILDGASLLHERIVGAAFLLHDDASLLHERVAVLLEILRLRQAHRVRCEPHEREHGRAEIRAGDTRSERRGRQRHVAARLGHALDLLANSGERLINLLVGQVRLPQHALHRGGVHEDRFRLRAFRLGRDKPLEGVHVPAAQFAVNGVRRQPLEERLLPLGRAGTAHVVAEVRDRADAAQDRHAHRALHPGLERGAEQVGDAALVQDAGRRAAAVHARDVVADARGDLLQELLARAGGDRLRVVAPERGKRLRGGRLGERVGDGRAEHVHPQPAQHRGERAERDHLNARVHHADADGGLARDLRVIPLLDHLLVRVSGFRHECRPRRPGSEPCACAREHAGGDRQEPGRAADRADRTAGRRAHRRSFSDFWDALEHLPDHLDACTDDAALGGQLLQLLVDLRRLARVGRPLRSQTEQVVRAPHLHDGATAAEPLFDHADRLLAIRDWVFVPREPRSLEQILGLREVVDVVVRHRRELVVRQVARQDRVAAHQVAALDFVQQRLLLELLHVAAGDVRADAELLAELLRLRCLVGVRLCRAPERRHHQVAAVLRDPSSDIINLNHFCFLRLRCLPLHRDFSCNWIDIKRVVLRWCELCHALVDVFDHFSNPFSSMY